MRKKILFGLVISLILFPGLTFAQDDSSKSEIPIPTLYSESAGDEELTPMLISENEETIPVLISENTPVPELINAAPVLYVDPISSVAYQVNSAYDAFIAMQKYGLGISQKDYERFSKDAPSRLDGRILLNVEDMGKAYIVDYKNNKLIYLGKPDNAFRVIKNYTLKVISGEKWGWVSTIMNNDEITVPLKPEVFTIVFEEDGKFNGTTDCNNYFGQYQKDGDNLSLGQIASTRMFCEGSQELGFTGLLQEVNKFMFDEKGNLILLLKFDSGSMIFEKR